MPLHSRLARTLVIAATVTGFAFSSGTALADPSDNALEHRSDNAQSQTNNGKSDDHQPAGNGNGRKVG